MTVVVVDNDTALLRSLEIFLSQYGHQVEAFNNPAAAAEYLDHQASPDALVVDYVMPGLSGLELLGRSRSRLAESCRVVLISGHTDQIEPLDLEAHGIGQFVPKPLDLFQLCRAIGIDTTGGVRA